MVPLTDPAPGVVASRRGASPGVNARVARASWWAAWAALAGLCAAIVCPAYVNHDAAWYLHMVRVVFGGGTMYRDVVDTNPPLIVFLTMPPVWLARFGWTPTALFKLYVFALALISLWVSVRLAPSFAGSGLQPGTAAASSVRAAALSRGVFATTLVFVALPFVRTDFGQREHFLVLMVLPYVMTALEWAATEGRASDRLGARALIGVAGGLGFAMKPHYVLGWVALEASLVAMRGPGRRWLRAEAVAAFAAMAVYGVLVVLFVPQYLSLAQVVREVYGGLNSSVALLMRLPDAQVCAVAAALLLLVRLPSEAYRRSVTLFAVFAGLLLGAVLQLKGWSYHLYPARAFEVLFFVTFALGVFDGVPSLAAAVRGGVRSLAGVVVAALLVSSGRYVIEARRPLEQDLVTPLVDLVRVHAPRGPLAVLSMRTIIYPAFPAVNYSGADWSLRHNSLWFLPGLYQHELQLADAETRFRAPASMPPLERRFYDEVIEDLCVRPPALLLVEPAQARAPAGRRALDLSAYYGQDERFRRLWSAYTRLTTLGPFVVYKAVGTPSCR